MDQWREISKRNTRRLGQICRGFHRSTNAGWRWSFQKKKKKKKKVARRRDATRCSMHVSHGYDRGSRL